MSDGPGIPLKTADAAAKFLGDTWNLPIGSLWVGSLRRRKPVVGDLDLISPLPRDGEPDRLFLAIDETLEKDGDMFQQAVKPLGRAESGHHVGFKFAKYVLRMRSGQDIKVNVWRFTPQNAGWMALYRTGPREFGIGFLVEWKRVFQIPSGKQALVEDHLRDPHGIIVPVETEADAFAKVGMKFIPPEQRGETVGTRRFI